MTLFSVVIPLYNKAKYIENTLKSVLNQTFTNFEIIIINDASTDESEAIVLKFNDERIRLYSQKNQGVSVARNLGIEKAKGKLIAFLDADDYWCPNHLEQLFLLYQNFPNCGLYCSRYKIKSANNQIRIPSHYGIESSYYGIVANYFFSNRPFQITWTSSLAIPKHILTKNGGFTPGVTNGQDIELWTKIGIEYRVAITNIITVIYNNDIPDSLSKNNIVGMKLMNFDQFKTAEKQNIDLKKFLDLHRIQYGFSYYVYGFKDKMKFYFKDVDTENISSKAWILIHLPSFLLRFLRKIRKPLKRYGIHLTVFK